MESLLIGGVNGYSTFHYVETLELANSPLKEIVIGHYAFNLLKSFAIHGIPAGVA